MDRCRWKKLIDWMTIRMVGVVSVSSGTGSPEQSWTKGRKTVVVVVSRLLLQLSRLLQLVAVFVSMSQFPRLNPGCAGISAADDRYHSCYPTMAKHCKKNKSLPLKTTHVLLYYQPSHIHTLQSTLHCHQIHLLSSGHVTITHSKHLSITRLYTLVDIQSTMSPTSHRQPFISTQGQFSSYKYRCSSDLGSSWRVISAGLVRTLVDWFTWHFLRQHFWRRRRQLFLG